MKKVTYHEYYLFLSQTEGIGARKAMAVADYFATPEAIFYVGEKELRGVKKLSQTDIANILYRRKSWDYDLEKKRLSDNGIRFISREDRSYPESLLHIYDPPMGIYVKGRMPDREALCIAVVGARNCSYYGRELAKSFSRALSNFGVQIVSGMARGIDGYAHEGAMQGRTASFAVLGSGADICYPRENQKTYEKLIEQGGILSEYPPGTEARAAYFPMRNRIISGIAKGILIIEAKQKSGSLITANLGLEQGKDIFAVPGRISDIFSKGCNNLIKSGANLVDSPQDILEFYQIERKNKNKSNVLLETTEKIVYANLRCEPKHIDEIMEDIEISSNKVLTALISLECKGLCKQVGQNYFVKNVV